MATSCTGTRNSFKGRRPFSIPSVRLLGVVVSVMMEEPTISRASLTAILTAVRTPSMVIVSFQKDTSSSPGVRNRLKTTVINSRKAIAFIPLTIKRKGTWDSRITRARNAAAIRYPAGWLKKNNDIINNRVPASFTLGSSL